METTSRGLLLCAIPEHVREVWRIIPGFHVYTIRQRDLDSTGGSGVFQSAVERTARQQALNARLAGFETS